MYGVWLCVACVTADLRLQSTWDRSFLALSDALTMYREKHPDEYATLVIDEPTSCFPMSLSQPETQTAFAHNVLNDLKWLGVHHGCDKKAVQVIYSSSSAAIACLGMRLNPNCGLFLCGV